MNSYLPNIIKYKDLHYLGYIFHGGIEICIEVYYI
jgi:hypothetical protein